MKSKKLVRALAGVALCLAGIGLELSMPRDKRHSYRIEAGGCRLVTDIVEPPGGGMPDGYLVLLHGFAGTKRVMSYMTDGFASQGLRVFVPDLPGHGRTQGPFSFARAEQCSDNLLRELIGRGLLDPEKTILAGHSMGGAIALRVASHEPVAGVIAVSPAPMKDVPGLPPETIPYRNFAKLPAHTLVMFGAGEPSMISDTGRELVSSANDPSSQYVVVPGVSHVSILFSRAAMAEEQNWVARALHITRSPQLPSQRGVLGLFVGLAGIITLVGPFLRELLQVREEPSLARTRVAAISKAKFLLEFSIAGAVAIVILRYWDPFRFLRLFEGDYFAGILFIVGVALLFAHGNSLRRDLIDGDGLTARSGWVRILLAGFAALLIAILFAGWFDLSFTEAWPTKDRLVRFLPFFLAVLPYHFAEEVLLGPANTRKGVRRLFVVLTARLLLFAWLVAGIFFLHSGVILPVLLAPYFALFCLGQRWATDVVREVTGSPSASALFGAILLSGFCLVVFPTT